jgi:branched-chain amino acid transport system ATP-binding protein
LENVTLRVSDVWAGYEGSLALFGISLEVRAGQVVALVGANGAGKTTTLRAISGLVRPESGQVVFEGRRIDGLRPHQITALGIAHVPEGRRVFGRLSVLDNLQLGAYVRRDPAERRRNLERVFSLFPVLYERRNQVAGTLSGGEQQMLAIGRGLMLSPKLLMLDEPSLGLAPRMVDRIFDAVAEIKRQGTTVLLVEQNLVEALELADYGYVIQTGRVVLEGPGPKLLQSELIRSAYLGL